MKKVTTLLIFLLAGFVPSRSQPRVPHGLTLTQPAAFLANEGQWPRDILFRGSIPSANVYLLKDGLSFCQTRDAKHQPGDTSMLVWNMKFMHCGTGLAVEGRSGKHSVHSFLQGNDPAKWVIRPMEYSSVRYRDLYPGIDLLVYGPGGQLKYDYVLHPGSDIRTIRNLYEGVRHLEIDPGGNLQIVTAWNTQVQQAPVAWQTVAGEKKPVQIRFVLFNDSTFGFEAPGGYDTHIDLVIDPLFQMVWSSYTKATGISNNINYAFCNAMDREGNVFLTGMVDGTFPITPGAYAGPSGIPRDIFVAKFSSDGTTLLYSTYLPGSSNEMGLGIAVDDSGRAFVTGFAESNITGSNTYPTTSNAYQPVHFPAGGADAILTVLNATGTGLVYSSYLGGGNNDEGYSVALGGSGIAYITGFTTSLGNFPIKASSPFTTGSKDVFVAKFDINQSGPNSLVYSTRIGVNAFSQCSGRSIAVDSSGHAYITGSFANFSGSSNYPTTPGAYNSVYNTGSDGAMSFVTKLSATTPVTLSYSTYLGPGAGSSIAVDPLTGEAYVTGTTRTFTFPVTAGALQPVHGQDPLGNPNADAFVAKLNAAGSALLYATFLGGMREDVGTGIAVNSAGEAYVTGTASPTFPVSAGAYQTLHGGFLDFFVVHLNATGTGYGCGGATYVGGDDEDYGTLLYDYPSPKVSLRDYGGASDTISVSGTSHSQNFPTTPGVYGPIKLNGIADQPVFFKMTCSMAVAPPVANFSFALADSCAGVRVNFTDSSGNFPSAWQWTFPGGNPGTSAFANPAGILFDSSGTYTVRLVVCNSLGCDSVTAAIVVSVPPSSNVNLGNDTALCGTDTLLLQAGSGYASYAWQLNGTSTGNNSDSLLVAVPGIYSVTATTSSGCVSADTVNVSAANPQAGFAYTLEYDCEGLLLQTENNSLHALSYSWDFGDGYQSIETNPMHRLTGGQDPVVTLIAYSGRCADTSVVVVPFTQSPLFDTLPNVITPNGDGLNDCLQFHNSGKFDGCFSLLIFNRWGALVYDSHGQSGCWSGTTTHGDDVPPGVYYTLVTILNKKLHGIVHVLR